MRGIVRAASAAAVFAYLTFVAVGPAHAYIDGGTGSYIFQLVVGGFVGAAFAIGVFFGRIRAFFARIFGRGGAVPPAPSASPEEAPATDH